MSTIYDLKKRAKELSEKNEVNSVSPVEVGNLIEDTLNIIDEYNKNVVGLGIRKIYSSIASMQADGTDPVGNDGKPIHFGQLVSVHNENNPESEENGGVYAFQSPGWKLATTTAINVVKGFGDSEIEAISQQFFTEQIQAIENDLGNESTSESEDGSIWGKLISITQGVSSNSTLIDEIKKTLSGVSLFQDLGLIKNLDSLDDTDTKGYYTYNLHRKGMEAIMGVLAVSTVALEDSGSLTVYGTQQVRYELGRAYRRKMLAGGWEEWEEVSGKQLKELGTIPLSGLDNPDLETGIYLYLSEDNVPGMLYVNHPASNTIGCEQHRIFRGQIYSRLYNKRNGAWTAWSSNDYVTLDQLDTLTDPLSTISSYTVYYQSKKIGILQCFTNSRADIVTQSFDGNWDIDVMGCFLPDCYVTEPRSLVRTYNISSADISGEIPIGSWGRWNYNQKVIKPEGGIIIE